MPQFQLDTGGTESHAAYDALDAFTQGYIEAAFFTGVSRDDDDGDSVELDGLGFGNLDAAAVADMVADCTRFQLANKATLDRTTESGEYDLDSAGNDFWFTRNGHGAGFWSRDLGDDGDTLTTAAESAGESDLFAMWDSEYGPDGPDIDDVDGWTVTTSHSSTPLTEDERAAFAALSDTPEPESLATVGSRYGAPMGRASYLLTAGEVCRAVRVTLDPGGYDAGGAYWGIGENLYRVIGAESGAVYFQRAANPAAAVRIALADQGTESAHVS